MAMDRQGTGLVVIRILIGVFFMFEGLSKLQWFMDPSILEKQLGGWHETAAAGSMVATYLERFAIPGLPVFARLVPIGEFGCGLALVVGFWTPVFAFLAFLMALNFQFASGALFKYSFMTSGYGLPVLGSTLGLTIGGVRLPWSLK
jgi:uncharacterized membrane protein YphA (DoxX/SURF4 family)